MLTTALAFLAAIGVAAIAWSIHRRHDDDRFAAAVARPDAKLVSHAHLIDGRNHIPVALTLGSREIRYGNADLDAAIDIVQIDEVEYGSDLVTGGIADGAVLRLRSHGRAIEFVLDMVAADKWALMLPPHRLT
jgi:hypothetical protein